MAVDPIFQALSDFFLVASLDLADAAARARSERISLLLSETPSLLYFSLNLIAGDDELVLELKSREYHDQEWGNEPFCLRWEDASNDTKEAWELYLALGGGVQRVSRRGLTEA